MSIFGKIKRYNLRKAKQEKLKVYEDLIFPILESPEKMKQCYEELLIRTIKYLAVLNDVEDLQFLEGDLPSGRKAQYQPKGVQGDYIAYNLNYWTENQETDEQWAYSNFFISLCHEIMHAKDHRELEKSGSVRIFGGSAKYGVREYLNYYPEKEEYKFLSSAIYLADRAEVLARQASYKMFENFLDGCEKHLQTQSKQTECLELMRKVLQLKKDKEKAIMDSSTEIQKLYLEDFKKDLEKFSQDVLQDKVKLKNNKSLLNLIYTQLSPRLYDENTLKNFASISQKVESEDLVETCKYIKAQNEVYIKKQSKDFFKL